ncbi:MAG: ATP-binding cassette domain-containing protein [Elusimicrobia bacterium]|jgi:energy-coupling factor transporter ATP-binding protein EcfA2|nr:ATP-binding cassette domain-containing protein [Elusimicrobiota bacterium]
MEISRIKIVRESFMGSRTVICDATAVFKSRINIIYGSPGTGKTTLLEGLAGVVKIDSGFVNSSGRILFLMQVPERGFIYPQCRKEISEGADISERDMQDLKDLGISGDMLRMSPWDLSRGEKKRVSFAAILKKARDFSDNNFSENKVIAVLDDPFGDLDIKGKKNFSELLFKNDNFDKIIMTTADRRDIEFLNDANIDFDRYKLKRGRLIG